MYVLLIIVGWGHQTLEGGTNPNILYKKNSKKITQITWIHHCASMYWLFIVNKLFIFIYTMRDILINCWLNGKQ